MDWTHSHQQPIYQQAHDPAAMQRGLPGYMQHSHMLQQSVHAATAELSQYASRFGFQALPPPHQMHQHHHMPHQQPQHAQQQLQQHMPAHSSAAEFHQPSASQPDQAPSQGQQEEQRGKNNGTSGADTQTGEDAPRVKKRRAKKPKDAPRRPKSAYMFFLAEFRKKWKEDHPEMQRVSDVGVAAGEAWRSLTPEQKVIYEEQSVASKATYAQEIAEYVATHPKPPKKRSKAREPGHLRRPTSAYFFFLNTFREAFKRDHPDKVVPVGEMGRLAGVRWTLMSPTERDPYERLSAASKALYARLKTLTPEQRAAREAAGPSELQDLEAALADEELHSSDGGPDDGQQSEGALLNPTSQSLNNVLAQQQREAASSGAYDAPVSSGGQTMSLPAQAASAALSSVQALQEAFEKHPAASFPLAQFLSMDHPTVSHWVPQQPTFSLPHQQHLHASSAPHQRQPSPQPMQQQLQQGLLRSLNGSPLPTASAALSAGTRPTSSGAA